MKIKNQTRYETKALRSLLCHVHGVMAKTEGRCGAWKNLTVTVVMSKSRYSGTATIGGWRMLLRLPPLARPSHVCAIIEHELYHSYGYQHSQMALAGSWWDAAVTRYQDQDPAQNGQVPVRVAPVKAKPTLDQTRTTALEHLQALKGKWEVKQRRAQAAIYRLTKRIFYLQTKLAGAETGGG